MICFSGTRIEPAEKFGGQFQGVPTLVDIALGLGRVPRFGGQTRRWWCGLHHAFVCHDIAIDMGVNERIQLLALLHDAHEAITGDVPAFFKPKELGLLQAEIDRRLFESLGIGPLTMTEHMVVKEIDDRALKAEAAFVGPPMILSHLGDPLPEDLEIVSQISQKFSGPQTTDGIDSRAAQDFYAAVARLIGPAVGDLRRDDTNRG